MNLSKIKRAVAPFLHLRKTTWDIEIYRGASPFALHPARDVDNPVLTAQSITDVLADFIADPFFVREGNGWYMYFETLVRDTNKGVICLATSDDARTWAYRRVVLEEPFHLSYPYVIAWNGSHYMIPESAETHSVRLYRAENFPDTWVYEGELLRGLHRDPSVFRHGDRWWMFSETSRDRRGTLSLHGADTLTGPWREHPKSPLLDNNPHITRPGGRVLQFGGRTYRIAQDTYPDYGMQLFAFEITELTATSYREAPVTSQPILKGDKGGLLADRIHHLDAFELADGDWIAVIDHARRTWQVRIKR